MPDDAEISFRIRRLEPFLRGRRAVDGQLGMTVQDGLQGSAMVFFGMVENQGIDLADRQDTFDVLDIGIGCFIGNRVDEDILFPPKQVR